MAGAKEMKTALFAESAADFKLNESPIRPEAAEVSLAPSLAAESYCGSPIGACCRMCAESRSFSRQ